MAYSIPMGIRKVTLNGKKTDRFSYVRALMVLHELRPGAVSRALGVTTAAVAHVIRGYGESHRIKKYIADVIGIEFKELWGHEYRPRKAA
ncbi:MAG: hypothetical protein KGZ88_09495 [Methylomicrobium sp.]|nr:hypothetical protein [Methylomicrobium sp.]